MKLAQAIVPGGSLLELYRHDGYCCLRIDGRELMSTRRPASERRLAELGLDTLAGREDGRTLVGGLGLGFTLLRLLEGSGPKARVVVVELVPEVIAWNKQYLAETTGAALADARVELRQGDVYQEIEQALPGSYDVALLDVDNGPEALVASGNRRLYTARGLELLERALAPNGRAVFWSAHPNASFRARLEAAGYRVRVEAAKAYELARRTAHVLYIADRNRGEKRPARGPTGPAPKVHRARSKGQRR